MATVYWYGGTGNWSDYANHWSNNSGNSPSSNHGAAPGTDDDVVFDTLSSAAEAAYTVTVDATANCQNFTMDGPSTTDATKVTWAGSAALNIYGSFNLSGGTAGITRSYSGSITYKATSTGKTINSNGVTMASNVTFDGVGGEWTLSGTYTSSGNFTLTNGSFVTGNQTITGINDFNANNSNTKSLSIGTSSISIGGNWTISSTGTTFSSGNSTITLGTNSQSFSGGGYTYYNVVINTGTASTQMVGNDTFTNLTRTGSAATTCTWTMNGNPTITGTLTINGNSGVNRILVSSVTLGTAQTITAASVSVTNADFRDITGAGAGSWDLSSITGGSGNCGGNTNITFTTADDWYWHADAGNISDYSKWYTETNGGGSQMTSTRVPLPQDTFYFNSDSFNSGSQTVTQDIPRVGSINFTGATNTPTFKTNITNDTYVFGSFILISGMTYTKNLFTHYQGRSSYSINTGGKTFGYVTVECPSGTYSLASNITSDGTFRLTHGTFDFNDFDGTFRDLSCSASTTRVLYMGYGTITVTSDSTDPIDLSGTGITLYSEESTFKISISSITGDKRIRLGTNLLNNIWINSIGTGNVYFYESTTLNNFKITAGCIVKFTAGIDVTVSSLDWVGTSTNKITLRGRTSSGWKVSDTTGTNNCEWLDIDYSTAEGGATFNAINSTDGGHNSGWNFLSTANTSNFFHFI